MPVNYGLVAGVLTVISYIPYVKDILAGKVKPERASWMMWAMTSGIALFSQLSVGASSTVWFLAVDFLASVVIFIMSIRSGVGGFSKRDMNALKLAGLSLVLWVLSSNPVYALILIIFIDAIATVLTAWKAYEQPNTETYPMWVIFWLASGAAILSVSSHNFTLMVYPIYFFLANFIVISAIFIGHRTSKYPK